MAYTTINPYNGKLLAQFETLTDQQLEQKLAAAAQCYLSWKNKTYAQRASIIAKAGELMHSRFDELARKVTLEMGKRINEARAK
ncbi:aldehyde dehydrogenase family protein [Pseudomonas sp. FEN]|uniref:aldehyde dehydrogenase family protein n=1 Tax=Pseudomonas sp. FEN TaxID=2767468 RepID=UPI0021E518BC|nr:aldehyde dehydrogenase family protein [Pseudomonas sp. FEN]